MTASNSRKPLNWDDYEQGKISRSRSRSRSSTSVGSQPPTDDHLAAAEGSELRRRSSHSLHVTSLAHVGGPNSIENFARSWQRAAGFVDISPRPPSFLVSDQEEESIGRRRSNGGGSPNPHKSLLRQQLEREESSFEPVRSEGNDPLGDHAELSEPQGIPTARNLRESDIINHAPYLTSPYASNYGGVYGSLSSRINDSSLRQAGRLFREQQAGGVPEPDKEREPLLAKRVEREDGQIVEVIIGQSTLPQTVFNSVNVLIGIGLLSLPLALKYSGWLVGMGFLLFSAIATRYTAGLLATCLDIDDGLVTFADLAYVAYGPKARVATSILFFVELTAAAVALVVLFADSLDTLIPGWGLSVWKIVCGIVVTPLNFVPLRFLSFTSVLGIVSCFGIVILVFVDGFSKEHTPGSLREPAATYLFPSNWLTLPLSLGLLMSPWGGHSVFPNMYRDMRHPRKYQKSLNITYTFTYLLCVSLAIAGILMFGEQIRDEITSNILRTEGYPSALSICIVVFIATIPLTKIPLNTRPIVVTTEIFCGLHPRTVPGSTQLVGLSGYTRGILKWTIRIVTNIIIILIAILIPSFDVIMAFLGSALTFTICIILPLLFYLKLFGNQVSRMERIFDWFLILICTAISLVGTVWVFIPKAVIGAD